MTEGRTRFGLIRHAPTLWNEAKRIQGQHDSPLSPRGEQMARAWGKELDSFHWDTLLSSDLPRVVQTAELINQTLHLPSALDPRLREQDWGAWTGHTLPDLLTEKSDLVREQERRGWNFRPPGGESRRDVLARSTAALFSAHAQSPGTNILVACHEGVIKCLLYHLLGRNFLPEEPRVLQEYHLHLLAVRDDTLLLEEMNCLPLTTVSAGSEAP